MAQPLIVKNLSAVTAVTSGASVDTRGHFNLRVDVVADTLGVATFKVQESPDGVNWVDAATIDFTGLETPASGSPKVVQSAIMGARVSRYVRVRLSSYTSGTWTAYIIAGGNADQGY